MRRLYIGLNILLWYFVSASIVYVSKYEFSGGGKFPFPLSVTMYSNIVTFIFSILATRIPSFRLSQLNASTFKKYVVPIAACVAVEISCSNSALRLLDVSFETILKGSAPMFVLFWALLLRLETFSWRLLVSLLMISSGIALSTAGEGKFAVAGLILMLISVACGGLRWALTHTLLQGSQQERLTPLNAMKYTAPVTALFILPFALGFEIRGLVGAVKDMEPIQRLRLVLVLTCIGVFVACLLLTEYALVKATSSLTVSVAAIFKELVTIVGSVGILHDKLSVLNMVGFAICQLGILDYAVLRYKQMPESDDGDSDYANLDDVPELEEYLEGHSPGEKDVTDEPVPVG